MKCVLFLALATVYVFAQGSPESGSSEEMRTRGPRMSTLSGGWGSTGSGKNCGVNETWVGPCASRCEGTCQQPIPTICTMECYQGCKCKEGYVRFGFVPQCIKKEDCPRMPMTPGTVQPPRFSRMPIVVDPPMNTSQYYRAMKLILLAVFIVVFCGVDGRGCKPFEQFVECGKSCEPTCQNPVIEMCTADCFVGCQCVRGRIRNDRTGACVKPAECPRRF
ncbi:unnamed protein product, partial [Mesorhabditis spiculigera]